MAITMPPLGGASSFLQKQNLPSIVIRTHRKVNPVPRFWLFFTLSYLSTE